MVILIDRSTQLFKIADYYPTHFFSGNQLKNYSANYDVQNRFVSKPCKLIVTILFYEAKASPGAGMLFFSV